VQIAAHLRWSSGSTLDESQRSSNRIRVLGRESIQYETWAGLMQILGWMGLPLIITAATGVLKNR
jgi:hypothetical protein